MARAARTSRCANPSGRQVGSKAASALVQTGGGGCFVTPRQVAVLPRHPAAKPVRFRRSGGRPQGLDLNQADVGDSLRRVEVKQDFIDELAADASVPHGEVFEFHEPLQVNAHLRQAPAASVAQFLAAKPGGAWTHLGFRAARRAVAVRKHFHQLADVREQAPRLRRQFVVRL